MMTLDNRVRESELPRRPWREPMVWLIAVIPAAAIIGTITMLVVASRSSGNNDVVNDAAADEALQYIATYLQRLQGPELKRIREDMECLLDYARPREVRVQPIDVTRVLESALDLLKTQGRFGDIALDLQLAEGLPSVVADPYQLEQVLVNLLLNATDAMDGRPDARLVIRTGESVHEPKPVVPARRKDDPPDVDYSHRRRFHQARRIPREDPFPAGGRVVEVEVSDNGPGIPGELIDEIFEPFVTTKEPGKGTGLGLAVAAGLVDAMGGTIRVDSPEGRGTTFTIVLPAAPDDVDNPREALTDALAGARRAGESEARHERPDHR